MKIFERVTEFLYWTNKISMKSVFIALFGVLLLLIKTGSWLDILFVFVGWNTVVWAIAREIKAREPKIGE